MLLCKISSAYNIVIVQCNVVSHPRQGTPVSPKEVLKEYYKQKDSDPRSEDQSKWKMNGHKNQWYFGN